jgi:hypothetical protein
VASHASFAIARESGELERAVYVASGQRRTQSVGLHRSLTRDFH